MIDSFDPVALAIWKDTLHEIFAGNPYRRAGWLRRYGGAGRAALPARATPGAFVHSARHRRGDQSSDAWRDRDGGDRDARPIGEESGRDQRRDLLSARRHWRGRAAGTQACIHFYFKWAAGRAGRALSDGAGAVLCRAIP